MITQKQINRFVTLTREAVYNEEKKAEYRRLGRKILTEIANLMGLQKGEYDIRWNPGGFTGALARGGRITAVARIKLCAGIPSKSTG